MSVLLIHNIDPVRNDRLLRNSLATEGAPPMRMYPDTLLDAMRRAGFEKQDVVQYENPTYEYRFSLPGHGYRVIVADISHAQNGELIALKGKLKEARKEAGGRQLPVLLIGETFTAAVKNKSPFKRFMPMSKGDDAIAARAYAIATREYA